MVDDNCTTFAVSVLKNFKLNPKIYKHCWQYGNGLSIQNMIAGTYYGYSPADAGEDIRSNYMNYIYKKEVTLKDNTTAIAVWDAKVR